MYDKNITEWKPEGITSDSVEAYRCTNETIAAAIEFIDSLDASQVMESDLVGGISHAIDMDKRVWSSGIMPDNALTTIVLLTDGRMDQLDINKQKKEKEVIQAIKQANKGEQIPIFALGVGFDANMDLLKDISDRTPGSNLDLQK